MEKAVNDKKKAERSGSLSGKLLVFMLGSEEYGIEVTRIKEIIGSA
jgi:chemotaxis signal transduction protein